MSLVIASTTDTQAEVNAAAGVTAPPKPSEAPPVPQEEPEPDGEPEAPDDPAEEESAEPQQPKKQNVQRRIDRITREKYQALGRVQELERRLAESAVTRPAGPPPAQPQQAQQPPGRPQESQFERYEEYVEALTDYKANQAYQRFQQEAEQRQAQERQAQQQREWQNRVSSHRAAAPDFDEVLADAEDIALHPAVQLAILEHEHGPKLAYELAKNRDELARIASLSPASAIRELGKFEARLDANGTHRNSSAVSKAPPPISPVGQGSTRSTKSPDEMTYREYKAWREKGNGRSR